MMWSSYCKANFSTHWKCLVCKFNKSNCRSCITNIHSSHGWISGYDKCAYTGQIIFLWLIAFFWIFCLNFLVFLKVILMLRHVPVMLVFYSTSYILRLVMFLNKSKRKITCFLKADMKTRMYIIRIKMKKLYWFKNKY